MNHKVQYSFWTIGLLCALLLVTGCRSHRQMQRTRQVDTSTGATQRADDDVYLPQTDDSGQTKQSGKSTKSDKADKAEKADKKSKSEQTQITSAKSLSAKMSLNLSAGSKSISVGGTYRLLRDDVIQLNLTYTVLIVPVNVGTLEITRDDILLIDRLNKRYCRVSYTDVPQLVAAGIDFDFLQSIFWGEATESPTKDLQWSYANWQSLTDGKFPATITFTGKMKSTTYKAVFNLSNIREQSGWETRTDVSSRYTAVPFTTILNALMSVAK